MFAFNPVRPEREVRTVEGSPAQNKRITGLFVLRSYPVLIRAIHHALPPSFIIQIPSNGFYYLVALLIKLFLMTVFHSSY